MRNFGTKLEISVHSFSVISFAPVHLISCDQKSNTDVVYLSASTRRLALVSRNMFSSVIHARVMPTRRLSAVDDVAITNRFL